MRNFNSLDAWAVSFFSYAKFFRQHGLKGILLWFNNKWYNYGIGNNTVIIEVKTANDNQQTRD